MDRRYSHVTVPDRVPRFRALVEPHASRTPPLPACLQSIGSTRIDEQLGRPPRDSNSPKMLQVTACESAWPIVVSGLRPEAGSVFLVVYPDQDSRP
jgi:hypothetical protein